MAKIYFGNVAAINNSDTASNGNYTNESKAMSADTQYDSDTGRDMGVFVVRTNEDWIDRAHQRENPRELWHSFWYENEVACLFADTNVGKSIYAMQIADYISRRGHRVLYLDFEMSDKQMQLRYSNDEGRYRFDENLLRGEFGKSAIPDTISGIVEQIGITAAANRCKVVIIDNITWICNNSESGDCAGVLMQLLVSLKRDMGLSILCLAHTPKRMAGTPLTQNSLAGSKRIANFMDSIFAIGVDYSNTPSGRYIKQIKSRNSEIMYGADNVIRVNIERVDNMLQMVPSGFGKENRLIETASNEQSDDKDYEIEMMLRQGKSQRQIMDEVHVSFRRIKALASRIEAQRRIEDEEFDKLGLRSQQS